MRRALLIAAIVFFDLLLLWPILASWTIDSDETQRVYYEATGTTPRIMLDRGRGGYVTEIAISDGALEVPAGRSIAVPLEDGVALEIRTLAENLAPYLAVGVEGRAGASAASLRLPKVLAWAGARPVWRDWELNQSWKSEKEWLGQMFRRCRSGTSARVELRSGVVEIQMGDCSASQRLAEHASSGERGKPLLVFVTGASAGIITKHGAAWQQSFHFAWTIAAVALVRLAALVGVSGLAPALVIGVVLLVVAWLTRAGALLVWFFILLIASALVVVFLLRLAIGRPSLPLAAAFFTVFAAQLAALAAVAAYMEVGTFGRERITRDGDDGCAIVGYSTVRGDSLRPGSAGIVEYLGDGCAPCRRRTSRFSREAQTLSWVRKVVCDPSFPSAQGGQVVFFGAGNDDIFYRPKSTMRWFAVLLASLRYALQPSDATGWEGAFGRVNELAVTTIGDQEADIEAAITCARSAGRDFLFVHDFLIWDLDDGRSDARRQTFEARRDAVHRAGGEFVDLLEHVESTAGAWFMNDWIHPSALGQASIAELICNNLSNGGEETDRSVP